jgi:hypothetical protein
MTDAGGRYAVAGLAPGAYTVTARRVGRAEETRALTLAGGGAAAAPEINYAGRAVEQAPSQLGNALLTWSPRLLAGVRFDAAPRPAVAGPAAAEPGAAPAVAVAPDGRRAVAWVTAPGGGSDGRLRVLVVDPAGRAAGAPAELRDPLGPIEPHGEAAAEGRVRAGAAGCTRCGWWARGAGAPVPDERAPLRAPPRRGPWRGRPTRRGGGATSGAAFAPAAAAPPALGGRVSPWGHTPSRRLPGAARGASGAAPVLLCGGPPEGRDSLRAADS